MKKILFFLACLTLGILSSVVSEAQTYTNAVRGAYTPWNLDTLSYNSAANAGFWFGETKSFSVGSNNVVVIQCQLASRSSELPASSGLVLYGSMDNSNWTKVGLTLSAAGTANTLVTIGQSGTSGGTYPALTPAALSIGNSNSVSIARDTIALGTLPVASGLVTLHFTIVNPTFTYYKLVWNGTGAANANYKQFILFAKYYFRKPY